MSYPDRRPVRAPRGPATLGGKFQRQGDFEQGLRSRANPFGSLELLLDASWTKKSADLDWFVECDYPDGTFTAVQSQSTERKLEDLQAGLFGGGAGLVCRAILYSFAGSSKVSVNFRTTGSEFAASTGVKVVDGADVPGLRERIREFKVVKRRMMVE